VADHDKHHALLFGIMVGQTPSLVKLSDLTDGNQLIFFLHVIQNVGVKPF